MTNATDALTDKIDVEPAGEAEVKANDGGPVVLPDHAAEAWAGVLIDIHEKRERMAADEPVNTETESPGHG
ncbi:hypothetical protein [Novipirellula rosea]|uniref:Uncharacterized protein n=1 Tax=Novipirellula rosea TaxID=1031540 RepID=A0ABP8M7V0_9BACT